MASSRQPRPSRRNRVEECSSGQSLRSERGDISCCDFFCVRTVVKKCESKGKSVRVKQAIRVRGNSGVEECSSGQSLRSAVTSHAVGFVEWV